MERDFMGLNNKDETRNGKHDSGMVTSGVQWPFSNEVSAMQQYMSYKERQNMSAPAAVQFSSSRYLAMSTADAFEASHKIAPRSAPQKCVNFDRKSVHQFPMHVRDQSNAHPYGVSAHQVNEARNFPLASRHPVPVSTSSNFFKLHDSQSIPAIPLMPKALRVGETVVNTSDYASNFGGAHRSMHSTAPMTAQLTIFYAGVVNVYDDVPLEKAQAIMSMASRGSKTVSYNARSEPMLSPMISETTKVVPANNFTSKKVSSPGSIHASTGLSSPVSVSSHAEVGSVNGSNSTDGTGGSKTASPLALTSQQEPMQIVAYQQESSRTVAPALGPETATSVVPKAIPQARKASLARFLEKRKERVINVGPYSPCNKKSLQSGFMLGGAKMPSVSLAANSHLSKNHHKDMWSSGHAKLNIVNNESLSTKLGM